MLKRNYPSFTAEYDYIKKFSIGFGYKFNMFKPVGFVCNAPLYS